MVRMDELEAMHLTTNAFVQGSLRELRGELAAQGLKKKELAEKIGVSYAALNRYMSGDRQMPLPILFDILYVLDLPHEDFWKRAQDRAASL